MIVPDVPLDTYPADTVGVTPCVLLTLAVTRPLADTEIVGFAVIVVAGVVALPVGIAATVTAPVVNLPDATAVCTCVDGVIVAAACVFS